MPKKPVAQKERHLLSKTSFIKSIQCLKQVHLYKHKYFLRDRISYEQLAVFKRGHRVGNLAWNLFPGGIDAAPKSPMQYQKAILQTQRLIQENQKVIYEASFQHNQCLSILDILVLEGNQVCAYEVKSSTSITTTYLSDAAFQYYVMTGAGVRPDKFFLIYVNSNYELNEPFLVEDYFLVEEITEQLIALQPDIEEQIEKAKEAILGEKVPKITIGNHCENPYKCDFVGYCRKYISSPNMFVLTDLSKQEQYDLYRNGKIKIKDISSDDLSNAGAIQQLNLYKENVIVLPQKQIKSSVESLDVGYFVFDKPAIPLIPGKRPYEPILVGFFWQKWEDSDVNLILLEKKRNYDEFLKTVEETIKAHDFITYEQDWELFFGAKSEPCNSILKLFTSKEAFVPELQGDFSFENLVKHFGTPFPYIKTGVNNHEEFKTAILQAIYTEETLSEEATSYIQSRFENMKSIWKFLYSDK